MKKINWLFLVVLASVAAGCDPYDDVTTGGTPVLLSATAADTTNGVAYSAVASGGTVTIDITCEAVADNLCAGIDPTDPDADELSDLTDLSDISVFITFDRQVDGGLVQATLTDCTPKDGWLSVTPTAAAGEGWYSCYTPSSPTEVEGGSVVVFAADVPAAGATVDGWSDAVALPAAPQPITITGTVAGQAVNVTLNRVDVTTCDTAALCGT